MSSSVELETRVDGSGGTLENTKPQKKEKRRKKKKKKSKSRPQQHEPEPERVDAGDESDLEKQAPPQSTESGIMRFKKYKRRWWILFIFGALNWANAFMWISFASIGSTTAYYYDVPRSSVNWLVLIFSIAYVPGTPVASYIYMKFGLREGVLLGAGFTMVGTWIRMVSVRGMANDDQAHDSGFVWVVIGQIVASGGQPFFTNAAARIAGDWFPLRERSLATTVGALFNPLGIATAQVIPPLIVDGGERAVNDRGEDVGPIQTVTGMPNLHLATGIVATVLFVLAYLLFESSPPVPPSKSAERKRDVLQSKLEIERATPGRRRGRLHRQVMSELKTLLMNPHFLVLTFAFAGGLAIFNGLLTLIEQLIEPYGYTDDDAGMLGGVIIAAGLTSATITSFVTDKYQNYNGALKLMMWLALASSIFVGIALEPHNLTMLAVAFACLGSSTVPVLPISFQCAAEATYPINEDLSSGILNVAGNLAGLIVVPVLDLLITGEDGQCLVLRDDQTFCPHRPEDGGRLCCEYGPSFEDNNPPITFICISVAVISIITMFYNGPYLRTSQDKKFKAEAADEDDDPFLQSPITNN